ncbi:MAG: ABC transporter substrate-binding protein [Anaerolineae bacterium]
MHRYLTSVLVALGLAVVLAPAAPVAEEAKPSKVDSGIQLVTSTDIVSKQRGWAEALLGVPIDWKSFESGRDAVLGLGARGVDWVLTGSSPTAFGLSTGVQGEVIWIFHLLGENEALVVRPGSEIEAVEDLRGKKVAAPFGSTTHYDVLKALDLAGVEPAELTLLDMEPPAMAAAFERGDIDAGWVWFPALQRLYDAGGVAIINALDMAKQGFPTADNLVLDPDFGQKYPDVVAKYIATLHCGVVLDKQDPDATAQDIANEFGIDLDTARTALAQVERLTAEELLDPKWMGTSKNKGAYAEALWSQAHFLKDQGLIEAAYDKGFYRDRLNPKYIELAIEKGYTKQCDQLPNWPR